MELNPKWLHATSIPVDGQRLSTGLFQITVFVQLEVGQDDSWLSWLIGMHPEHAQQTHYRPRSLSVVAWYGPLLSERRRSPFLECQSSLPKCFFEFHLLRAELDSSKYCYALDHGSFQMIQQVVLLHDPCNATQYSTRGRCRTRPDCLRRYVQILVLEQRQTIRKSWNALIS